MQRASSLELKKNYPGYLLIAPAVLGILLISVYPLVSGIVTSFQDRNMMEVASGEINKFVGFKNYIMLFKDEVFLKSVKNTFTWTVLNLALQMILGVVAALVLNTRLKARFFYRTAVMIPWIVPSVVAALNWRWMYDPKNGIINIVLVKLGIIPEGITWLGELTTAMPAVILESVWKGMPFVMLLILAGLQTIPAYIYEAAVIDGATKFQILMRITLPYIKDTLLIAGILTTIHTINNFNAIWLMTAGGPLDSTEILFTYAYKKAFMQYQFGTSAAISTIIFVLISILTMVYIKLMKWGEE